MRLHPHRMRAAVRPGIAALLALVACATSLPAQVSDTAWDGPRVTELMERARARRLLPAQDTSLRNYTAAAEGFVYFYLDRRDTQERTLIKTDQIALELFWAAPDRTKQRIVGLRDESRLPNRMHYHLDHLTVVQNGFGDIIRLGDGDEVRDVPHPAARLSETTYSFRLADSMTIALQGSATPIRVYEIQVKPRSDRVSALVGSIFVDRATADVVRMTFTFTPVSYVDPRLDYISVSLENALWEGKYWLPHEQTLQIRRQVPFFDFAASAIIHGRMRVTDYTFNDSLPENTFLGYPVTAVPEAERERFDFPRGLYDDLNEAGLEPPPDLESVRAQAAELLGTSRLSGLPSLRLGLGSASGALRFNRAEGVAIGAGLAYTPGTSWRADVAGGYAFGAEQPWVSLSTRRQLADGRATARAFYADARDIGFAAVPGVINTLAGSFLGRDYTDLYYADGAEIGLRRRLSASWWVDVTAGAERQRSAELTHRAALFDDSAAFRPVRSIDEGTMVLLRGALERPIVDARADAWGARLDVELGSIDGGAMYLRPTASASLQRATADHERSILLTASGGLLAPNPPPQRLFLLGGIGTLPGYDFRSFVGDSYILLNAEARAAVREPWLAIRALGAVGATGTWNHEDVSGAPASLLRVTPPSFLRTSAGAGLSLFWDLLRIDAVRGLDQDGRWQILIGFHRDFRDIS